MKLQSVIVTLAALTVLFVVGCSEHLDPTGSYRGSADPRGTQGEAHPDEVAKVVMLDHDIDGTVEFDIVDESNPDKEAPTSALASWLDGTRVRYGWDYDHDFYIDYKTPRSCCYRVSMTYFLYQQLQAAGKPLVVYGLSCNADGTITWRIIIGASAVQRMSPVSDWFLVWQAKMQYVG